ncbi:MAG: hypothetical protein WAU10_15800, partial [Caldilineaceae bacterium]
LNLLSREQACGRIALAFFPEGAVSRLFLGVPAAHVRLVEQMAVDFEFSLKPVVTCPVLPLQRLTAVSHLSWDQPFVAHLVAGSLFVSTGEKGGDGDFLPAKSQKNSKEGAPWRLLEKPMPGLTLRPMWLDAPLPPALTAVYPDPRAWLLGKSQTGVPLHMAGPLNLYGRQEAAAHWLVCQITQMLAGETSHLVVIDGKGDLVSRLKRKAVVTRLLGEQLTYVDLDSATLSGGFNPLAPVPGEMAERLIRRWQQWFQGMAVHPQSLPLLAQAYHAGVADIPALRKWLKQQERQGKQTGVSSLSLALNRLTASRAAREWLEWPTNRFDNLPDGLLFFACQGNSWERRQLLKAVVLAVLQIPDIRLVLHGLPWKELADTHLRGYRSLLVSNGPCLPDSAVVLTACHPAGLEALSRQFFPDDVCLRENVALLAVGEGAVLLGDSVTAATWNKAAQPPQEGMSCI